MHLGSAEPRTPLLHLSARNVNASRAVPDILRFPTQVRQGCQHEPVTTPTGTEWIAAFAERLGVEPPDADTIEALLDLAGVAAHASERLAAPLACYLIGRSGIEVAAARAHADALA